MLFGLFSRRERWGLSARGWFTLAAFSLLTAAGALRVVYPFLAVTSRADAELLAVEGWIHDYAIRHARKEFDAGRYHAVYATGGPVQGVGGYLNDYSTAASIGANRLKREGVAADRVHMAPSRISARDRTYSSAIALRDLLRRQSVSVRAINIVTEDVHARRTRLLFQLAFGPDVAVGVISVPNPDYDATRWWGYSEGVRDVLGETISYIYAKFFFFPSSSSDAEPPQPTTE